MYVYVCACVCVHASCIYVYMCMCVHAHACIYRYSLCDYFRLLYTSRVVFNNSVLLNNKATVILLTPNGQLIAVSVPFHLLLRLVCMSVSVCACDSKRLGMEKQLVGNPHMCAIILLGLVKQLKCCLCECVQASTGSVKLLVGVNQEKLVCNWPEISPFICMVQAPVRYCFFWGCQLQ